MNNVTMNIRVHVFVWTCYSILQMRKLRFTEWKPLAQAPPAGERRTQAGHPNLEPVLLPNPGLVLRAELNAVTGLDQDTGVRG